MGTTRTRNTPAGYSLVELMIVLVVLSVGILALVRLLSTASREQVHDRLRTLANYYAQEKIETLRTLSTSDANLADGRHPSAGTTEALGSSGALQRYWTISHLPDPLANIARADVVVSWRGPRGRDSVLTSTYINH